MHRLALASRILNSYKEDSLVSKFVITMPEEKRKFYKNLSHQHNPEDTELS